MPAAILLCSFPQINTLQSAVLSNAKLFKVLLHTRAAPTDTNKLVDYFPNWLLCCHPHPSSCFSETSRPEVGSPVRASSTTKGAQQLDPADYLRVEGESHA